MQRLLPIFCGRDKGKLQSTLEYASIVAIMLCTLIGSFVFTGLTYSVFTGEVYSIGTPKQ